MSDRALWRTQKVRAEDVAKGDVTRNKYGWWDVVISVSTPERGYMTHTHELGGALLVRTVDLIDVQAVCPS